MNFCNGCKYLLGTRHRPESSFEWKCAAPANKKREFIDPLTGETKVIYRIALCKDQREADYNDRCGIEGKWYEEYTPPQFLESPESKQLTSDHVDPPFYISKKKPRLSESDLTNL